MLWVRTAANINVIPNTCVISTWVLSKNDKITKVEYPNIPAQRDGCKVIREISIIIIPEKKKAGKTGSSVLAAYK